MEHQRAQAIGTFIADQQPCPDILTAYMNVMDIVRDIRQVGINLQQTSGSIQAGLNIQHFGSDLYDEIVHLVEGRNDASAISFVIPFPEIFRKRLLGEIDEIKAILVDRDSPIYTIPSEGESSPSISFQQTKISGVYLVTSAQETDTISEKYALFGIGLH